MRQPGQHTCGRWIGAGIRVLLCALTLWAADLLAGVLPVHAAQAPMYNAMSEVLTKGIER